MFEAGAWVSGPKHHGDRAQFFQGGQLINYKEFLPIQESESHVKIIDCFDGQSRKHKQADGTHYDFHQFNYYEEPANEELDPEEALILHLIADAIACLKDRWVTKTEKVDAFDWLFSPLEEEVYTLKYYCDLIGAEAKKVQEIASQFMVSDVKFANSVRYWW